MIYRIDDKDTIKVDTLLSNNNIKHERYYGPLSAFCKEEAIYRVEQYEIENKIILTDEQREYLEGHLECIFDDNDYIVDGDYLCDLSWEGLDNGLEEYKKSNPDKIMTKAMIRWR